MKITGIEKKTFNYRNIIMITGKLINCERFDTSRSGNPRYLCCLLHTDGHSTMFYTGVDSMHGYGITNYLNKEISVTLKHKRNKLTLENLHHDKR
jgi:hypothetical protein